jgi:hypothetical protein
MRVELQAIIEDFERLWTLAGFAEPFSARLAAPPARHTRVAPADPAAIVLAEHRRLLVGALRRAQRRGDVRADCRPEELASALVGFYLSRRLAHAPLRTWVRDAVETVLQRRAGDRR